MLEAPYSHLLFCAIFLFGIGSSIASEIQIKCVSNQEFDNTLNKQYFRGTNQCIIQKFESSSDFQVEVNRDCQCVECLIRDISPFVTSQIQEENENKSKRSTQIEIMNLFLNNECIQSIMQRDNNGFNWLQKATKYIEQTQNRNLLEPLSSSDPQNSNSDNQNQEKKDTDDSDSNTTMYIIIIVVVLVVLGCCGGIMYIRNNNDSGFASLTANLENDKLQMIQSRGIMSIGSGGGVQNLSGINIKEDEQESGKNGTENNKVCTNENGGSKKFSKRQANMNGNSKNQKDTFKKVTEGNICGIELQLEENNLKDNSKDKTNGQHSRSVKGQITTGNLATVNQLSQSKIQAEQQTTGEKRLQVDPADEQNQQQKPLDTSAQNNFFSIDGEDEKHDKIMDSIHLDYQSDDTTFSNVFNLEGEESSKPQSNRKKKKQKQHNHLFFEDANQE